MRYLLITAFLATVIGFRHGARTLEAGRRNSRKGAHYGRRQPTLGYKLASQVRLPEVKKKRSRFLSDLRRIVAAGKSDAAKHLKTTPIRKGYLVYDIFDPILRKKSAPNFDGLSTNEKIDAIRRYSIGLKTIDNYSISSLLFERLMMQLPWWPSNFILTILQRVRDTQMLLFFFYKNQNDVKMAMTRRAHYDPTATIDVGIRNPKYVRVAISDDHAESIVGENVECRAGDGNCFFYAVLGAMTPEMRAEFFANAKHEYSEDNYKALAEQSLASDVTHEQVTLLLQLRAGGIRPNMSLADFNRFMGILDNYFRLQGVKEDVQFIRNEMDKVFKQNAKQYIEYFGLPK